MNIILSFDYEIYFKKNNYNSIVTLIKPTTEILRILNSYNIKSTFFIDAGYLITLEKYKHIYSIEKELEITLQQIHEIESWGHEIGFHVHSHWEDSIWKNGKWEFNLDRYKLSDFSKTDAQNIFKKYFSYLNRVTKTELKSFRAGGWCIEPFDHIRQTMIDCGIVIDSTVFSGGKRKSNTHFYDFTNFPTKDTWEFNEDPSIEITNGHFREVSISSMKIDRSSYLKLIGMKFVNKFKSKSSGNGISPPLKEIASNFFQKTSVPVSLDSVNSELVMKEFNRKEHVGDSHFSIISHPKCMNEQSMKTFLNFIQYAVTNGHTFSTISGKI
jgi:hypothetical protein